MRWYRDAGGQWQSSGTFFSSTGHGTSCGAGSQAYAWCPERSDLTASIHPLASGTCELQTTECGDGRWTGRVRISPLRSLACDL